MKSSAIVCPIRLATLAFDVSLKLNVLLCVNGQVPLLTEILSNDQRCCRWINNLGVILSVLTPSDDN